MYYFFFMDVHYITNIRYVTQPNIAAVLNDDEQRKLRHNNI